MFRLDLISSELAEDFRRASLARRREAAVIACELAIARTCLEKEDGVAAALAHLRRGEQGSPALGQQLKLLVTRLDEAYLDLYEACEETNTPEVIRLFNKARAASALDIVLSEASDQFHEAIYEAIAAVDDGAAIIGPVAGALRD